MSALADILNRWESAETYRKRTQATAEQAVVDANIAANKLGDFLTLEDSKAGEVFNVWVDNGVLSIRVDSVDEQGAQYKDIDGKLRHPRTYTVTWRKPRTRRD